MPKRTARKSITTFRNTRPRPYWGRRGLPAVLSDEWFAAYHARDTVFLAEREAQAQIRSRERYFAEIHNNPLGQARGSFRLHEVFWPDRPQREAEIAAIAELENLVGVHSPATSANSSQSSSSTYNRSDSDNTTPSISPPPADESVTTSSSGSVTTHDSFITNLVEQELEEQREELQYLVGLRSPATSSNSSSTVPSRTSDDYTVPTWEELQYLVGLNRSAQSSNSSSTVSSRTSDDYTPPRCIQQADYCDNDSISSNDSNTKPSSSK